VRVLPASSGLRGVHYFCNEVFFVCSQKIKRKRKVKVKCEETTGGSEMNHKMLYKRAMVIQKKTHRYLQMLQ
jgi:hypothetical protein